MVRQIRFSVASLGLTLVIIASLTHAQEDTADQVNPIERAEAIVAAYTPANRVTVEPFSKGWRVIGVTAKPGGAAAASAAEFRFDTPEWLDPARLLGTLPAGSRSVVDLLWRVESTTASDSATTVSLQYRYAYQMLSEVQPGHRIVSKGKTPGSVLWTSHTFDLRGDAMPGLYNVLVNNGGAETVPLGQVLVTGAATSVERTRLQIAEIFPEGHIVFAGRAILTDACGYRFPVEGLAFEARRMVVLTATDWLLQEPSMTTVANLTIEGGGQTESFPLCLGRDTAPSWYDLHARGNLPYERPPIAWSYPVENQTTPFDAHTYRAEYVMTSVASQPDVIDVAYTHQGGVLRLYGIVLLP